MMLKRAGRTGNAGSLLFDGINDYLDFGNNASLNWGSEFSLVFFIKPILGARMNLLARDVSTSDRGMYIDVLSNGSLRWVISSAATSFTGYVDSVTLLNNNVFNHVVFVYKNSTLMNVYINAILSNVVLTGILPSSVRNTGNLTLAKPSGGAFTSAYYKSNIFNFLYYSRVLQLNEIKLLSQGLPISRSGLVGKWNLNSIDPKDTSGQGNDGINNGATFSTDKPF